MNIFSELCMSVWGQNVAPRLTLKVTVFGNHVYSRAGVLQYRLELLANLIRKGCTHRI